MCANISLACIQLFSHVWTVYFNVSFEIWTEVGTVPKIPVVFVLRYLSSQTQIKGRLKCFELPLNALKDFQNACKGLKMLQNALKGLSKGSKYRKVQVPTPTPV